MKISKILAATTMTLLVGFVGVNPATASVPAESSTTEDVVQPSNFDEVSAAPVPEGFSHIYTLDLSTSEFTYQGLEKTPTPEETVATAARISGVPLEASNPTTVPSTRSFARGCVATQDSCMYFGNSVQPSVGINGAGTTYGTWYNTSALSTSPYYTANFRSSFPGPTYTVPKSTLTYISGGTATIAAVTNF